MKYLLILLPMFLLSDELILKCEKYTPPIVAAPVKVTPPDKNVELIKDSVITYDKGILRHDTKGDYFLKFIDNLANYQHMIRVTVNTVIGKDYYLDINTNQPLKIYFTSGSRKESPAHVTVVDKIVSILPFTATEKYTTLLIETDEVEWTIIKTLTVKEVKTP